MLFQNVFNKIREFGNRVIEVITNKGVQLGKKATGKTLGSLVKNIKYVGEQAIELAVFGLKSFEYIEEGRPAGAKMPPVGVLREWMISRGIPLSAEFVVRRSIARKGIQPTPLLETSFIEINRQFENNLSNEIATDLSRTLLDAARRGFILPVTNI